MSTRKGRETTWTSAMARRDLDAVWTVLDTQRPTSGIEVSGTGYQVAAGEVLAGIDADRRRHLLIPLLAGEAARTDTRGRAVHVTRVSHRGVHFLAIVCLSPDLHTVFTQFARELVDSVEAVPSPARSAVEVFDRWRALFSDAVQHGVIGEEKLVGLLGELLTVETLIRHGAPGLLSFWTGPLGQQHDFRSPSYGLEVKSSLVREGRVLGISSIDQLDAPAGVQLCLAHHRIDRDPGGFSLEDVVRRVLSLGCSRQQLTARLREVGVDMDDLSPYAGRRFRLIESRLYDVGGYSFPRITRSSFAAGDIPPGTLRLSYSIDLTNQPPNPLNADEAERVYYDMARDASDGMGS